MAGMGPNPVCTYTRMRSSQPNPASCAPDCPFPLSLSLSSTTLPSSQDTMLGHPSLSLHDMIMSWHRVQHTPSTAYTEYSIHLVQRPPRIDCLPFVLMITNWELNVASASGVPPYTIECHQPVPHECSKVTSPCHIPKFASQLTDE